MAPARTRDPRRGAARDRTHPPETVGKLEIELAAIPSHHSQRDVPDRHLHVERRGAWKSEPVPVADHGEEAERLQGRGAELHTEQLALSVRPDAVTIEPRPGLSLRVERDLLGRADPEAVARLRDRVLCEVFVAISRFR